jgi:hypothetical protein
MNHFIHLFQIIFSLITCCLYPLWYMNGYLDTLYLKIAVFIACYGSFIGGVIWYTRYIRDKKLK